MRVLLTGGGSGGHLFPLIAVGRKLKSDATIELLYVGPDSFSRAELSREGIRAKYIVTGKVRRYASPMILIDFFKMPIGFFQSYWHIFLFMPDVVFAKGGYGSFFPVLISFMFRVPTLIHESDSVPGLANRILSKFSKRILVSFAQSAQFFPKSKTAVVGNPIRETLFGAAPENPEYILGVHSGKPLVLILGGSQGAQQLNELLMLALPDFVEKYEIVHQCGEKNFDTMQKVSLLELENVQDRESYHLYRHLSEEEMASAFSLARVVVSRAGSGAIFEIAAAGKPSVLIPYTAAAGNHQALNADVYAKTGAAIVLEGENLTPHMLIAEIDLILRSRAREAAMSEAARNFAKPDAASKIAEEIVALAT